MSHYNLTDRQKELLRSIADGLERRDGTVSDKWIINTDRGNIVNIKGLSSQIFSDIWQGVTSSDLDDFVDNGFFRDKGEKIYTLRSQDIIHATKNDFASRAVEQQSLINPIFGSPANSAQFQCDVFVLMPFAPEFLPIHTDHLKPIAESLNLTIKRADDFFSKHEMIHDIWSAIYNSQLVIADCTGKNANVFYELGTAHTLDKPAIMVTQSMDDIPFDLRGKRAIVYKYTPPGMKQFEKELKSAITKILAET